VNSQTCFFDVSTRGKGLHEITSQVQSILQSTSIREGVVTVFIRHTSASLIIFENASLKKRCQEGKFLFIYYQQLANNVQSTVSDICF